MDEYCAGCTQAVSDSDRTDSPLRGCMEGLPGHHWHRCDGCGWHLFDDDGESACAPGRTPEISTHAGLDSCYTCRTIAENGRG